MTLYLTLFSILCLFPGASALTDADVGVIAAGVISGLLLIALVIGVPVFVYFRRKKRHPEQKRGPPKDIFANGHAPKHVPNGYPKHYPNGMPPPPQPRRVHATPVGSHRGVPVVHITPHGSHRGTPRGSRMGTPLGSVRGPMRGGSARIVFTRGRRPPMMYPMGPVGPRGPYPMGPVGRGMPYPMGPGGRGMPYPGPYSYPDPMMYPYTFFPPPFAVYDDESDNSDSDDERGSNRSTVRERKMRYRRSFIPDRQSKLVIKEIDSDEERKIKAEEDRKKKKHRSKSRSRSRSPGDSKKQSQSPPRRRPRTPSPERYPASTHQDLYTEVSRPSIRRSSSLSGGDAADKIDEMFSFSSDASAKPGDIIFVPQGQHVDMSTRRRETTPPRRDPTPPPKRDRSPQTTPRRDSSPPRPERKLDTLETTEYTYASVIRPADEPENRRQPELGVSMSETIQNIVESGHSDVIHDFEKHKQDDIQYPPKGNSISKTHDLSRTSREYSYRRDDYGLSSQRLAATAKPDLYETDRFNSDHYRRPSTPPNDIPNDTPVPTTRQSAIRRPPTPPNDIPLSSRSERPSTPPFDGDDYSRRTSTPSQNRRVPPPPPITSTSNEHGQTNQTNSIGNTLQARTAFSNLVLEELKERQRVPGMAIDDDDSSKRAVNFSASPPEIIPRSVPNSPRASQNLYPDEPPNERAPPPPPPPPPPAPPLPK